MNHPRRKSERRNRVLEASYEPTPEELRRACDDIQNHWTRRERARRTVMKIDHWTAPMARTSDIHLPNSSVRVE